jgi:hypothetical protein
MVLKPELGPELAHAVADDADPDLAVGNRLPRLACPSLLRASLVHAQTGADHCPQRDGSERAKELPSDHRMNGVVRHNPASFSLCVEVFDGRHAPGAAGSMTDILTAVPASRQLSGCDREPEGRGVLKNARKGLCKDPLAGLEWYRLGS